MNAEVAQLVSLRRRQPSRQYDGQWNNGKKKIPKKERMCQYFTPSLLPVVHADNLHRIDGAENVAAVNA